MPSEQSYETSFELYPRLCAVPQCDEDAYWIGKTVWLTAPAGPMVIERTRLCYAHKLEREGIEHGGD